MKHLQESIVEAKLRSICEAFLKNEDFAKHDYKYTKGLIKLFKP